ncbi:DNA-binding response OmpR family regulator [Chitinophaga skermanii]|uniref:DNA-binding response OmpR family regulator n=1 Tax=Chitinophaga skermanii TaxID=331697 RepID=A0A327Q764_9BACT|nr:response regulator transcription factor [Chitinophaga skermanii]RAI97676.1 DNA-binding response OmpR family regulator [Chitinophaga skermanii]
MEQVKVLLVEDENVLAGVVKETLAMKGFDVTIATNGVEGLQLFQLLQPSICIVDIMMPKKDGITLVTEIRAINDQIPLIFLTAKSEVQDVIKGFQVGADDYMKKPFSIEELIMRMQALLKRVQAKPTAKKSDTQYLLIGDYQFDYPRQTLHHPNGVQRLSQREADILKMLADNLHQITARKDMLMEIWGDDSFFNARNMDVYMTRMRKFLQYDERIQIVNVRGKGYKLIV